MVLLARTSKAAARLTEQFRTHAVEKIYWALVEAMLTPPTASISTGSSTTSVIAACGSPPRGSRGPRQARLDYRRLSHLGGVSLVEVELQTGRKHQIRVQLAHHGHPIVGDRKYGSRRRFAAGIALHARRLSVAHPVRDETLSFEAPLPQSWADFGLRG